MSQIETTLKLTVLLLTFFCLELAHAGRGGGAPGARGFEIPQFNPTDRVRHFIPSHLRALKVAVGNYRIVDLDVVPGASRIDFEARVYRNDGVSIDIDADLPMINMGRVQSEAITPGLRVNSDNMGVRVRESGELDSYPVNRNTSYEINTENGTSPGRGQSYTEVQETSRGLSNADSTRTYDEEIRLQVHGDGTSIQFGSIISGNTGGVNFGFAGGVHTSLPNALTESGMLRLPTGHGNEFGRVVHADVRFVPGDPNQIRVLAHTSSGRTVTYSFTRNLPMDGPSGTPSARPRYELVHVGPMDTVDLPGYSRMAAMIEQGVEIRRINAPDGVSTGAGRGFGSRAAGG